MRCICTVSVGTEKGTYKSNDLIIIIILIQKSFLCQDFFFVQVQKWQYSKTVLPACLYIPHPAFIRGYPLLSSISV